MRTPGLLSDGWPGACLQTVPTRKVSGISQHEPLDCAWRTPGAQSVNPRSAGSDSPVYDTAAGGHSLEDIGYHYDTYYCEPKLSPVPLS